MFKRIFFCSLAVSFIFCGCTTLKTGPLRVKSSAVQPPQQDFIPVSLQTPGLSAQLANMEEQEMEKFVSKKGVIFAKTDFQGVLNTSYVTLFIEDTEDPFHKFELHVGEKTPSATFPWEVKIVKPGYFFIELPAGQYKIFSISIPVGSTLATEESHIYFDVLPDIITYVGTLRIVGTKEKIKLGGVPVIKPGFDYSAQVVDEQREGLAIFKERYPGVPSQIQVKLMEIKQN